MTATHDQNSTIPTIPVLYFSLELGNNNLETGRGDTGTINALRAFRFQARLAIAM